MEKSSFSKYHELFYNRYEYKAKNIARKKIWDYEVLGMSQEDIEQEFRLKLWSAIPEFIKKWTEYRNGGYKPVPLPFYLDRVLDNKRKDIIRKISNEKLMRSGSSSSDYDVGTNQYSRDTQIDLESNTIILDGVDLLRGFTDREKKAFIMFVRGHKMNTVQKIFKDMPNINKKIREQITFIRNYHSDLTSHFTNEITIQKILTE